MHERFARKGGGGCATVFRVSSFETGGCARGCAAGPAEALGAHHPCRLGEPHYPPPCTGEGGARDGLWGVAAIGAEETRGAGEFILPRADVEGATRYKSRKKNKIKKRRPAKQQTAMGPQLGGWQASWRRNQSQPQGSRALHHGGRSAE